jgi:hypothetical protein
MGIKVISEASRSAGPLPKFPVGKIDTTVPLVDTPVVNRHTGDDEGDDNECLQGF